MTTTNVMTAVLVLGAFPDGKTCHLWEKLMGQVKGKWMALPEDLVATVPVADKKAAITERLRLLKQKGPDLWGGIDEPTMRLWIKEELL